MQKYADTDDLRGCFVLSNGEARRRFKHDLRRVIPRGGYFLQGNVIRFENSRSLIKIAVAADRHHGQRYDDVIIEYGLNDVELMMHLLWAENSIIIGDLGDLGDPSQELIDYFGGINAATYRVNT